MKQFRNILVSVDTRSDDYPIVEEAAELAAHSGASLKLVDVVPEFPWTVRLTLKNHEQVHGLMAREKQEKLDELAAPIRERGIHVDTKVLRDKCSVELIREVLREKHDLVLRVAKGQDSRRNGFFGTTSVHLLRECPCAVWLVSPAETHEYKHVLGCIDTSTGDPSDAELNGKVYESAALVSQKHGATLSIAHAWSFYGEELFHGRMRTEDFDEMKKKRRAQVESLLDRFLLNHGSGVAENNVHMIKGDPHNVIPEFASKHNVDLVVMGTVARSGAAGMIIGNTAERILNHIECSVLALKPDSFVSPITLGDYINPTHKASEL